MSITLRQLCLGGHSLNDVTRMLYNGMVSQDVYESYHQLWRRGPRIHEPYRYSETEVLAPDVVGPLGAMCIARFFEWCAYVYNVNVAWPAEWARRAREQQP